MTVDMLERAHGPFSQYYETRPSSQTLQLSQSGPVHLLQPPPSALDQILNTPVWKTIGLSPAFLCTDSCFIQLWTGHSSAVFIKQTPQSWDIEPSIPRPFAVRSLLSLAPHLTSHPVLCSCWGTPRTSTEPGPPSPLYLYTNRFLFLESSFSKGLKFLSKTHSIWRAKWQVSSF